MPFDALPDLRADSLLIATNSPVAFYKATDLGAKAKKLVGVPAPDVEEAYEVDEDPGEGSDAEGKESDDEVDISKDKFFKQKNAKGKGKTTAGKGKGKSGKA